MANNSLVYTIPLPYIGNIPRIYYGDLYYRQMLEDETDYFKYAYEAERVRRPFDHKSSQIEYRMDLLRYITGNCIQLGLLMETLYVAVYLLDFLMDSHQISITTAKELAISCITLAASVHEIHSNVPKLNTIWPDRPEAAKANYNSIRNYIIKYFNWQLLIQTPAQHISHFQQYMISFDELHLIGTVAATNMVRTLETLQYNILLDAHLLHSFPASKIAASLIAICRMHHGLPPWNQILREFVQYDFVEINPILCHLIGNSRPYLCINCSKDQGSFRVRY